MSMRGLVTGGTGCLGTFVVRALLEAGEISVVLDVRRPGDLLADLAKGVAITERSVEDPGLVLQAMALPRWIG